MTTPPPPANEPEPMTFAEIRALQTENAKSIAELRASQEQQFRNIDRLLESQAENAKAIAELRASQARIDRRFERLMESHRETRETVAGFRGKLDYTSQDVSTLKGWGLEFLCERRPGDFARALNLSSIELFPREKMSTMAMDAARRGIIHGSEAIDLDSGDVYFYGRRAEDDTPVYLIVQVSFAVSKRDVKRASSQADTLDVILRHEGPPEVTGVAIPVVAGTRLGVDPVTGSTPSLWDVTFVQIENGNQLTA